MHQFARAVGLSLLLAMPAALGGCSGGASGLTTSAVSGETPSGINNEHPMARPISAAWTSARAKRCGFYFDPGKLRDSYLRYEPLRLPPHPLCAPEAAAPLPVVNVSACAVSLS